MRRNFYGFATILLIVAMLLTGCGVDPNTEEGATIGEIVEGVEKPQDETDRPSKEEEPEKQPTQEELPKEQTPEEEKPSEEPEKEPEKQEAETPAPEEPTSEDPKPEEEKTDESTEEETEPSYEGWIKLASYNTKSLMHSADRDGIVEELKEINADIIGIQEIDSFTSRSGQYDQMKFLAEEAGYPYFSFDKLIDYQGGAYGMGILSRYPITSSEVVQYAAQCDADSHVRKYGRHVLDVNGKEIVFYNTHLAIRDGDDETSVPQLEEVLKRMNEDKYALLTGDFNMKAPVAGKAVAKFKNVKILNSGDPNMTSYIEGKLAADFIDNIMTTQSFETYWDDWSGTGIMVSKTPYSDHNMVYTYVNFKK